ncbi:alpha/beta hydrolase [Aerococcus kribbianus]|uniref:Alpha/beta hydrolase n=1 Tax=Aerococcus kribbianus TaxID=2999064 RepID=A0A9X3FN36_9LACT|nr:MULTISPECIES: alpha/beta hydrolase [unclassified Aerococcus]MCZ0717525.1 alpha/beta hydrolase [Aerococcus sp. YH-aer221]MCZ0725813.1 alpha/beta hydrolase [Aerococcus sp. YH-aer222]
MSYTYRYIPSDKENANTLLLLHGTGGNENDLLDIGRFIDPNANLLSLRGNEPENGMNRFFKRLAPGQFDEENLKYHVQDLYTFIADLAQEKKFDVNRIIPLGYSNGANLIAASLYSYANPYSAALLLHPMVPFADGPKEKLDKSQIFIAAGNNDPICAPEESQQLTKEIEEMGGEVNLHWETAGHSITSDELRAAKEWYERLKF